MSFQFTIDDADAMRELAGIIAGMLKAEDVVVLDGPLGAGKTTFTQGLGAALAVQGSVTSPTFVVSRIHRPTHDLGLVHVDAYRLNSSDELFDLELDRLGSNVLVMEWGLPYVQDITDSWLQISISRDDSSDQEDPAGGTRMVHITGHGPRWAVVDLSQVLS